MKFKGGEMKYILQARDAAHCCRERSCERKDKMGFPVPLHLWARGRARDFFHDVLLSQRCRERGLFDPAATEAAARPRRAPSAAGSGGSLNLELWYRSFIDGD